MGAMTGGNVPYEILEFDLFNGSVSTTATQTITTGYFDPSNWLRANFILVSSASGVGSIASFTAVMLMHPLAAEYTTAAISTTLVNTVSNIFFDLGGASGQTATSALQYGAVGGFYPFSVSASAATPIQTTFSPTIMPSRMQLKFLRSGSAATMVLRCYMRAAVLPRGSILRAPTMTAAVVS